MSINFNHGRSFDTEHHGNSRFAAQDMREAVIHAGQHLVGEAVILPSLGKICEIAGVSSGAFLGKGFDSYCETISHATGLQVVEHRGLIVLGDGATLQPFPQDFYNPKV